MNFFQGSTYLCPSGFGDELNEFFAALVAGPETPWRTGGQEANSRTFLRLLQLLRHLPCMDHGRPKPANRFSEARNVSGQFLTVMASESTAFLPVTPSSPVKMPR
jgi:hypothetical protein